MFLTPADARKGLLVAVVSGGRPTLERRPVRKFLPDLEMFGPCDVIWSVCERDVPEYETDEYEISAYPTDWALDFARTHRTDIHLSDDALLKGGLVVSGREWAIREAERRGCWGVLQLDDNIERLAFPRGGLAAFTIAKRHGGMALFADLLAAVTLSTNSRMTGAQLDATVGLDLAIARAGFPYSLFVERVGEGREERYGPFEEDIIQAYQYGRRWDGSTAAIVPTLRYMKRQDRVSPTGTTQSKGQTHKSGGGLRSVYDHSRSVQLQRMFPEGAHVRVMKSHSNGKGDPRIFHKMIGGPGTPLRVLDPDLFGRVKDRVESLLAEWKDEKDVELRQKLARRAARLERLRAEQRTEASDA